MSRTSVHSEPRESSDLELRIKQLEEEQDRLQEQLIVSTQLIIASVSVLNPLMSGSYKWKCFNAVLLMYRKLPSQMRS